MKINFSLILLSFLFVACHGNKQLNKNNKMETVKLVPIQDEYVIKLGQKLSYSFTKHPSVGLNSSYAIERERIIELKETIEEPESENKENLKGADKSTITWVFAPRRAGRTKIIIKDYYRGDLKDTYEFVVQVEMD